MTAVSVIGAQGKTVDLPEEIFAAKVNVPLIHQVVVAQQAAARQGTHSTKTRGQVRGGGKKPYRQKGTGRARQGSLRAPQYTGGGVVPAPVPRSYAQRTPKKMKAAALRGALSDRLRHGRVLVVSAFVDGDAPKTKDAVAVLTGAIGALIRPVLVVAHRDDDLTWKSLRNVPRVHVLAEDQLNTYDVLASDHVVFTEQALTAFVDGARRRRIGRRPSEPGQQPAGHPAAAGGLGEELRAARRGQVHLRRRPGGQQDPDQAGRRGRLRGQGDRGQHREPARQAPAHPVRLGQASGHQASDRDPRRGGPDRHLRRLRRHDQTWLSVSTSRPR